MSNPKPIKKQSAKPKKVVRHHPFERALTWAKNRLLKAEADRKKHYDAVVALDQEIPKLREIIRVHGGNTEPRLDFSKQVAEVEHANEQRKRDRELLADIPMPHAPIDPQVDPLEAADQLLKNLTKK